MSDFNAGEYFRSKRFDPNGTDKIAEVEQASIEKLRALAKYSAQRRASEEANKDSWVSQLDLNPNSATGKAVNLAASLASGASRHLVGLIASLPANLSSFADASMLEQADIEAFNRYVQGTHTPEDMARLNAKPTGLSKLEHPDNIARREKEIANDPNAPTTLELISRAGTAREIGRGIDKFFNIESIVHQDARKQYTEELGQGFDKNWGQVQQGWEAMSRGEDGDGLKNLASGLGKLIYEAGAATANNPGAASEYITENAPQLLVGLVGKLGKTALTASNLGYGADLYQQGIQNYQKQNGGKLPSVEESQRMAMHAAGAVLAESLGDKIGLDLIRPGTKEAARVGLKQALKNSLDATVGGGVSEGATEGVQTYLEGEATGKEATAKDIYLGSTIGAVAGAGLSGGMRTAAELAQVTPEHREVRDNERQAKVDLMDAVKTGNAEVFLDKESKSYDPIKAAQVLHGNSVLADTSPEVRQQNLTKMDEVLGTLEQERAAHREFTPEGIEETKALLAQQEAKLASASPEEAVQLQEVVDMLREGLAEPVNPKQAKQAQDAIKRIDEQIAEITSLKADLAHRLSGQDSGVAATVEAQIASINTPIDPKDTAAVSARQANADTVINLSMASTSHLSPDQATALADNANNGLSTSQRNYLRKFAAARIAENAAMDLKGVQREVFHGDPAKKQLGIANYRQRVGAAVASNNQAQAQYALKLLSSFEASHQQKLQLALQMQDEAKTSGKTLQAVRTADGRWELSERLLSKKEQDANGGFKIYPNSSTLINAIKAEAHALSQAKAELQAMSALKFQTPAVDLSTSVNVQEAQVTAPAVDAADTSSSNQSTVDSTVNPVEGSTDAVEEAKQEQAPKRTRERIPPNKWQNIVGAILRVTDGFGFSLKMANTLTGEDAKELVRTRKAFSSKGQLEVGEVIERLNSEEGYSIRDQEHLYDLLRRHESGDPVYNDARIAEIEARNKAKADTEAMKAWRREINAKAKALGIKQARGKRTIDEVIQEIEELESVIESQEERTAIQEIESFFAEDLVNQEDNLERLINTLEEENDQQSVGENSASQEDASQVSESQTQEIAGDRKAVSEPESREETADGESAPDVIEEAKITNGKLTVLQGESVKPEGKLASVFRTMNKAKAWLTQKESKGEDGTQGRPLVDVKDFMQRWKEGLVTPTDYFPEDLIDEEKQALKGFFRFYEEVAPVIRKDFIKGSFNDKKNKDYLFRDPVQDLVNEDGSVDENLVTAVAYAAFSWLNETARAPARQFEEDILDMHGQKEDDAYVTREGMAALQYVAALEDAAHNSLGRLIVNALGLKAKQDASVSYLPQLTAALGAHATMLLERQGYVEIQRIPADKIAEYIPSLNLDIKEGKQPTFNYIQLVREGEQKVLPQKTQAWKDSQLGSKGVVDRLFDAVKTPVWASWTPVKFSQDKAKRTQQGITERQAKILDAQQQIPNRIIPAMWNTLEVLGDALLLKVTGYNDADPASIQLNNREAVKAKNDSLVNQLEGMKELVQTAIKSSPLGIAQPFYAAFDVWRNYRVGVHTRDMNLQSSKIHRFMFFRPEWETKLNLSNTGQVNTFLISIAQAFGEKIDKKANDKMLNQWNALVSKEGNRYKELSLKVFEASQNPEAVVLTEGDKADIADLAANAEGMQTLQAMVAYGAFLNAQAKGEKEVTVHLLVGVDGKTNGPILTHLALGAAASVKGLLKKLNMGGMFGKDDGVANFNKWYERSTSLDLYEDLARAVIKTFPVSLDQAPMQAIQYFTGNLLDDQQKVSSKGRNLVKTPLTAFAFGSSLDKSVAAMKKAFIDSIYDKIESVANKGTEAQQQELLAHLNGLMSEGGIRRGQELPAKLTSTQLLELELSFQQLRALEGAFHALVGLSVESTMKTYFAAFIERRNAINTQIRTGFEIYNAVYQDLYAREMDRLMSEGEINFREETANKKTGEKKRIPLHGMNKAQLAAFQQKIQAILPVAHTAYSQQDGNLGNGLFMAKTSSSPSKADAYGAEVQFGQPFMGASGKQVAEKRTQGKEQIYLNPGVAGLPYFMHSLDSAIMHFSIEGTETLNVHDEASNGVGKVNETARAINQSTWNNMLEFSPAAQAYNMVERIVEGTVELIKAGQVSQETLAEVTALLRKTLPYEEMNKVKNQDLPLTALTYFKEAQIEADRLRLQAMAQMASIDQYTWENGQYEITDQDRARAQELLDKLDTNLSPELEKAALTLGIALSRQKNAPKRIDMASTEQVEESASAEVPKVSAPNAEAIITAVAEALPDVQEAQDLKEAVAQGKPVVEAINAITRWAAKVRIIQAMADVMHRMPKNIFTPWGETGTPVIAQTEQDQQLEAYLKAKGTVSAEEMVKVLGAYYANHKGNQYLLHMVKRAINTGLQIQYITPTSPANAALDLPKADARGWYVSKGNGQEKVHVLSSDFKHSALTGEVLLHELVHASLTQIIRQPNPSPEVQALITDLESVYEATRQYVEAHQMSPFKAAVENLDEFLAWGMTNEAFQKEVLAKVTYQAKTNGNPIITGLKAFINTLADLFFTHLKVAKDERAGKALGALIINVSGLMAEAAKAPKTNLNDVNFSMAAQVYDLTTTDIYEALDDGKITGSFDAHLRGLLDGIVTKLHGPFGSFMASRMTNQPMGPLDVWMKAKVDGVAPFASQALASGFPFSEQEAFVLEQVEATIKAAIDSHDMPTVTAYKELSKLYLEVRGKLNPADFDPDPAKAQALYDFVFKMEADASGRTDHLARFAALGLANERFNQLLKMATDRTVKQTTGSFAERLENIFNRILEWFLGKLTHTYAGQQADEKLTALVDQLVTINTRKKHTLLVKLGNAMEPMEDTLRDLSEGLRKKINTFAQSNFFKNSKNGFVQATGSLISTVAQDRVDYLVDGFMRLRDEKMKQRHGILAGILNEARGAFKESLVYHALLRMTKNLERLRKETSVHVSKVLLESFANEGKDLTQDDKAAITKVFLRTDMAALLDSHGLAGIQALLQSPTTLNQEIQALENQLAGFAQFRRFQNYFMKQGKLLAYYMATGEVRSPHLMMNARNIVRMEGTPHATNWATANQEAGESIVDKLVTLYALRYTDPKVVAQAKNVLAQEMNRGNGNGVEMVLKYHRHLQQDSRERLFQGSEGLMFKGYLPEIFNPKHEFVVADAIDGAKLEALGYIKKGKVQVDPRDPDRTVRHMYFLKDGGQQAYLSGIFSLTGMNAKGSRAATNEVQDIDEWMANQDDLKQMGRTKVSDIQRLFAADPNFDPSQVQTTYAAPVLNPQGKTVDYRYLMNSQTKDDLLERDNRFDKLLGTLAGNIFDKETAADQNRKAVEALHEQYLAEYSTRSTSYVEVGPNSPDKEMRDLWRMLPDHTKAAVEEIWGREGMRVRYDLLDINFGYRKLSLSNAFTKDAAERSAMEKIFVDLVESFFGKKAGLRIRKGEDIWEEIVRETKDILVIKSFFTLWNNLKSNISLNLWCGVNPIDLVKNHRVAFRGASDYRRHTEALAKLQAQLDSGYVSGNTAEIEREITFLQGELTRNPVRELIEAGLMPSIVEDVSAEEDMYSYKSRLVQQTERFTNALNPAVVKAGRVVYMAKEIKMYKALSYWTQVSDFMGRYTLYRHLTQRQKNPLSKAEAIQKASDAFVNYDVPSHRLLQYLNDKGLVWFTKYYIRIQKVLASLYRENPGRALGVLLFGQYLEGAAVVTESSFVNHMNNPFSIGAFKYPGALDDLATVKAGMALFK